MPSSLRFFLLLLSCISFTSCIQLKLVSEKENGQVVRAYQVHPKTETKQGSYKEFEEGKLVFVCTYKKGMMHGSFTYYFAETGNKRQTGTYNNNKIEGNLLTYYENSQLKETVSYENNFTKGPFKEYNENGTIAAEGTYTYKDSDDNLEHGLLQLYDTNGVLEKKMICKEGICCTIWTAEEGDTKPSSDLCATIIRTMQKELKKK